MSELEGVYVSVVSVHENGLDLEIKSKDLYETPMVKLTNKIGELIAEFPIDYLKIFENAHYLMSEYNKTQKVLKKNKGNPYGKYDFLIPADLNQNVFIMAETKPGTEGKAFLEWVPGNEEDLAQNREATKTGWKLCLYGAEKVTIQFALWDDLEGIDGLIKLLREDVALSVILGLTDQESSKNLASRKTFLELKKLKKIPAVKMTDLRKMIIANDLNTEDGYYKRGTLSSLFLKVNDIRVPVAISIKHTNKASWSKILTKDEEELPLPERHGITKNNQEENKVEWFQRFDLALARELPEWRSVSLPNFNDNHTQRVVSSTLWVTNLSKEVWEAIAPAAAEVARTKYFRGSNF